jgi:glycosyltransferase involved in cell wall biosynthesis
MKIIIYCPVFYPMIGGMETVTECTADLLIKAGHECIVITPVKFDQKDKFPFRVYRNSGILTKIRLILWADIVYSNGASLALLFIAKLLFKPFVWKHAGYQASCIDGLGWVNGVSAPIDPWGSVKFHFRKSGLIYTSIGAIKLLIRRFSAKYLVDMNVAITNWVASRQPFKRQTIIYNPSPLYRFISPSRKIANVYDFVYMGRLVSEKGLKILIKAFKIISGDMPNRNLKMLIIGDGNIRSELENMVSQLGIQDHIVFAGRKTGQELTDLIHSARIAVVPSEWEEPMGIVAIELMAAGRNIIVSESGGLKECVEAAGLTFPNGNAEALARCMARLLDDQELSEAQKKIGVEQVRKFDPVLKVDQYISLFKSILKL